MSARTPSARTKRSAQSMAPDTDDAQKSTGNKELKSRGSSSSSDHQASAVGSDSQMELHFPPAAVSSHAPPAVLAKSQADSAAESSSKAQAPVKGVALSYIEALLASMVRRKASLSVFIFHLQNTALSNSFTFTNCRQRLPTCSGLPLQARRQLEVCSAVLSMHDWSR